MAPLHVSQTFFAYVESKFSLEEIAQLCAHCDAAQEKIQETLQNNVGRMETLVKDILHQMQDASVSVEEKERTEAKNALLTSLT